MQYTILIRYEDDAYSVVVPALKGCQTYGLTLPEAIANAQEAIEAYIASLRAAGEPVPVEAVHPQTLIVTVAA